jgi:hypothetical protein
VDPRLLPIHYLKEVIGLSGSHMGCETSLCGTCTVEVNGAAGNSRKGEEIRKMLRNPEGEVLFEDGKCTDPKTGQEVPFRTIAAAAYRAMKLRRIPILVW